MKKIVSLTLCLISLLALAACGGNSAPTSQNSDTADSVFPDMTIQVGSATQSSETDGFYVLVNETAKLLSEWTDGAVKLEYLGDGQLGNESELAEAIKLGTIDAAIITTAPLSASVPAIGLFDMPYLFTSAEQAFDFLDNSEAIESIKEKVNDSYGGTIIGWAHNGFRHTLNNTHPIKSASDFKGLKIRVMESPVYMQLFSLLGANPTPMAISECFTGLEQGTVDGMDHPISASYNAGGYKLVKYFDLTQHTCTEAAFMIRTEVFEAMSPELQDLFYKAAKEAQDIQRAKLQELENGMLEEMEAYGVTVGRSVDVESIQSAVLPMYKDYRDNLDPEIFDEAMQYLNISVG